MCALLKRKNPIYFTGRLPSKLSQEDLYKNVRISELEYIKRAGPLLCVRYWLRSDQVPRKLRHDEIPTYVRST